MARQIVMDHTGDTRHQFDPGDAGAVDLAACSTSVTRRQVTRCACTFWCHECMSDKLLDCRRNSTGITTRHTLRATNEEQKME
jgi:hypothetical protein